MKDRLNVPIPDNNRYKSRFPATDDAELFQPNTLFDDLLNIAEFKKVQIDEKNINSKSSLNLSTINSTNDINLIESLKSSNYPDKDYKIKNYFLRFESEKENNSITNRIKSPSNFSPGLFSDFSFLDKVTNLVSIALTSDKSIPSLDERETIDNSYIVDMSLGLSTIKIEKLQTKIERQETKKIIKESTDDEKRKAIFEYENQIAAYQTLNDIDIKVRYSWHPPIEEDIDLETYYFFRGLIKQIKNRLLRNKLKLIMKAINYVDPYTNKNLLTNGIKNKIYRYWKKQYIKELEKCLNEVKTIEENIKKAKQIEEEQKRKPLVKIPINKAIRRNSSLTPLDSRKIVNAIGLFDKKQKSPPYSSSRKKSVGLIRRAKKLLINSSTQLFKAKQL